MTDKKLIIIGTIIIIALVLYNKYVLKDLYYSKIENKSLTNTTTQTNIIEESNSEENKI